MEDQKNELMPSQKANSLSKNLNSAADAVLILAILVIGIYLYQNALIKVQEGGIGSFERFEIDWKVIFTGIMTLLGSSGLSYILKGISGIIKLLYDIKEK